MLIKKEMFFPLDAEVCLPELHVPSQGTITYEKRRRKIRLEARLNGYGHVAGTFSIKRIREELSKKKAGPIELKDSRSGVIYRIKRKAILKILDEH